MKFASLFLIALLPLHARATDLSPADRKLRDFRAEHPDFKSYTPEERAVELKLETNLASETMGAGFKLSIPAEANAGCLYATDNLAYALPGSLPNSSAWKDDGHLRLPKRDSVVSEANSPAEQRVVTRGGGVLFAKNSGARSRAEITLAYDGGYLQRVRVASGGAASTMEYGNGANGGCRLKRVVVESRELKGTKGVSFDEKLCEALQRKSLLDPKLSAACSEFNAQVGEVVDKFSASLPKDEAFTIFKARPDGSAELKKYEARDYPSLSSAIVDDCRFSWKPARPAPTEDGGVERGAPASPLDPAGSGVERGAPGFSAPAP